VQEHNAYSDIGEGEKDLQDLASEVEYPEQQWKTRPVGDGIVFSARGVAN